MYLTWESITVADHERFNDLVDVYYGSLTAFAFNILGNREQAEDIVQDVFVKLWLHRKNIDSESSLKNYLYVSTRNASYNHIRSFRRFEHHIRNIPSEEDSVMYMIEEESNRILFSAINRLPESYSEVIRLSMDGLRQDEIARLLDIALPTVKSLKSRAIKKLKKLVEEQGLVK